MDLKTSIVIKSKFGTTTPGRYIDNYSSREDATESLEIKDYISKYTPRMNATESLKQNISTSKDVELQERKMTSKEGVMFGNHGLSYSEKMLHDCARNVQKATDEGHVPILQVISFTHDYLKEKGIIPIDMDEPKVDGEYKGKVDQLKLRQGITDMMGRLHRDMGFNKAEWGAAIHLDTKHVHVHITTVETDVPNSKRLKKIKEKISYRHPRMQWYTVDKTLDYTEEMNENGFITYRRNGEIIAEQEASKNGNPKWVEEIEETGHYIEVERGKISEKVKKGMRDQLNRSLSKTKDIKPFVKEVGDKKRLTKALTLDTVYYNDVTVEKLKILIASLPDNKKLWRAKSNAKAMQRPNEIANDIIEDIWTKNKDVVNLDAFDRAARMYAKTRQYDEKFDDKVKEEQIATAYNQLKEESINMLYKDIKKRVNSEDKTVDSPKYAIKSISTEALKNEIVKSARNQDVNNVHHLDKLIQFEFKQRDYSNRLKKAHYEKSKYHQELSRYDYLDSKGRTSQSSKVVREFYEQEYEYYEKIHDKYRYLKYGEASGVTKNRFQEVKGVDLINMLYDYGKGEDRTVPKIIAEKYVEQTNTRKEAINRTLDYLIETNQIEQYEILRNYRNDIRKEADIAEQIQNELSIPIPPISGTDTIEMRKTIDTIQGRRLLKQELQRLEQINRDVAKQFQLDTNINKYTPKSIEGKLNKYDDFAIHHQKVEEQWAIQKLKYNHFYLVEREKQEEEKVLSQFNLNVSSNPKHVIEL